MLSGIKLGGKALDLSTELSDAKEWNVSAFRSWDHLLDVVALAVDPVLGLFAAGTATGVIYLSGNVGVTVRLLIPEPIEVKYVQFATSASKLVCADAANRLYVWDLAAQGRPKLQTSTKMKEVINAIHVSPTHSHMFVALSSGVVKTYDLLCLRFSPYTIENVWLLYLEKLERSGLSVHSEPRSESAIGIESHPRDLNLVFVLYSGGIVLMNVSERSPLRTFQYILPPGAPGGNGYAQPDLMTFRCPPVTAISIHPTGHFFAVGHEDGSVAFWATDDNERPLLVRTLDDLDVNLVDGEKIPDPCSVPGVGQIVSREPIFKLAWSGFPNSDDPRGGATTLTILGGLNSTDEPGINVIELPAFNPSEPPATTGNAGIHPYFRQAMRQSLTPINATFYPSSGSAVVQDFLLVPRESPHFSGNWDPSAIIIVSEAKAGTRSLEVYRFSPPRSAVSSSPRPTIVAQQVASGLGSDDSIMQELSSTLESLSTAMGPVRMTLSPSHWSGSIAVINGELSKVERDNYKSLLDHSREPSQNEMLSFDGGSAWVENTQEGAQSRLVEYQPHRLLMTIHEGGIVNFRDISIQLLKEVPLTADYPRLLTGLSIDVGPVLLDPSVSSLSPAFISGKVNITGAQLCSEASQCALVLDTGHLILYRLKRGLGADLSKGHALDKEVLMLGHIPQLGYGSGWCPDFMLSTDRGPVSSFSLSDYGFLAASYTDASLFIVHKSNREPSVLLRMFPATKAQKSFSSILHHSEAVPFTSLTWTVCETATDPTPQIRLVAVRASGHASLYTVLPSSQSPTGFEVQDTSQGIDGMVHPFPQTFILESKTGRRCKLNRRGVGLTQTSSRGLSNSTPAREHSKHCVWICAGEKGVKTVLDLNGSRVAKIDWPAASKLGTVQTVQVVDRSDAFVLAALTDKGKALVYSLPSLDLIHTLELPSASTIAPSLDESGDFVIWHRHMNSGFVQKETYGSLFNIRRSPADAPIHVDLVSTIRSRTMPPPPQPINIGPATVLGTVGSWLGVGVQKTITAEQLDIILAGPDRPLPRSLPPKQKLGQVKWSSSADEDANRGELATPGLLQNMQATSSALYGRLGNAVDERGEMLSSLQEHSEALQEGTRNMLKQAKQLAASQATKGWFGGLNI
ncbi:hypothetical protein PUNSTDRAFT_110047 [Punctularia strigosozonata HHB-11173 SS5]|uniref:uncharacterized protein n=1 Tax=Punctularia strigosozonata (strain HHB-11173) TaxID=741275 RepID=UPI0004416C72|nr:uncharacterized protein PUNSTDRAFT_110047 [Punctularia strigosozonata HHB-11173 SS5]EIN13878.1 hypothetical protein PUNSTDRAFT_110047 [Punctularia strigosozonata HHB-11173 SS5]